MHSQEFSATDPRLQRLRRARIKTSNPAAALAIKKLRKTSLFCRQKSKNPVFFFRNHEGFQVSWEEKEEKLSKS